MGEKRSFRKAARNSILSSYLNFLKSNCSQVTIFVIVALVIIGGIGAFFWYQNYYTPSVPADISPVYNYYISCLQSSLKDGKSILGSQGGYITPPDFEQGSEYAPFSNQFGFAGLSIPYWSYISSNNIHKEQVPTIADMQNQLENYLMQKIVYCDFSSFENNGYNITIESPSSANVKITDNKITASLNQRITIIHGDSSFSSGIQRTEESSNLGKFYNLAIQVYNYENQNMFIENYSVDVLYTYAPVSGVILNCSPTVWNPYNIFSNLKNALTANLQQIQFPGSTSTNGNKYGSYYVAGKTSDIKLVNENVRILYSGDWPSRFEVWPTKNNLMIANPVGNQPGLSTMGFCYAPYKFVYDMYFPVLVQIYDKNAEEVFQFPIAIIIQKNNPRVAVESEYTQQSADICDNANTEIEINTYNVNLDPVESAVSFKCFTDVCNLGKTKLDNLTGRATLTAKVPQCVNGIITASSLNYKDKKYIISTNEENSADIVLDREYNINLEVYVNGALTKDMAILTINENLENSTNPIGSFSYPYNTKIKLSEGDYKFDLKVYKTGAINIPAITTSQCINAPKEGILGLFGLSEEKCTDITVPSQKLSNVVYAGGSQNYYLVSGELEKAQTIRIYAKSTKIPSTIEEAQDAYDSTETRSLDIEFV